MSPPRIKPAGRAIAAAVAFGALLAGCSDIYYDRRETIALGAEDAVASNTIEQMVDPWPRYSNNNNLAFNGERMQRAVECYRKDKVTQPADLNPSTDSGAPPPVTGDACAGTMTSGSAAAAAPVAGAAAGAATGKY
jgi:hypothetical protein